MNTASFKRLVPYFLESWPEPLVRLAVPFTRVPLPDRSIDRLTGIVSGESPCVSSMDRDCLIETRRALGLAVGEGGRFVRYGNRSTKAGFLPRELSSGVLRVDDASQALRVLAAPSPPVARELLAARRCSYPIGVFVRPWISLDPWQEWRCIVYRRRLIGITQYATTSHVPAREGDTAIRSIRAALQAFLASAISRLHVESALLDVLTVPSPLVNGVCRAALLDLNPLFPLGNLGHFSTRPFPTCCDASFRYRDSTGRACCEPFNLDKP